MLCVVGLPLQKNKECSNMNIRLGIFLVLISCYGCEPINNCDGSLTNCVRTLGGDHKEHCYKTYHACVTRGK